MAYGKRRVHWLHCGGLGLNPRASGLTAMRSAQASEPLKSTRVTPTYSQDAEPQTSVLMTSARVLPVINLGAVGTTEFYCKSEIKCGQNHSSSGTSREDTSLPSPWDGGGL